MPKRNVNQQRKKNNNRPKRNGYIKTKQKQTNALSRMVPRLSACARSYGRVLENPFSGQTSCIPTEFNFPTMKHSVRCYGTTTTGTAGIGFVSVSPFQMAFFGTTLGAVNYTSAAYAGTTFATEASTGVFASNSDTPYVQTATPFQIQARLVACGLRIRNTTSLLNRGGILIGLEEENHQSLGNYGFTVTTCMNEDTAVSCSSTTNEWNSVVWHPQAETEIQWYAGNTAYNTAPFYFDSLGFIFQAPTGSAQTYEFEVVCCFEAKGTTVHGLSPSESDPQGFATVQNSTSRPVTRQPQTGDRAAWADALLNAASRAADIAVPAALTMAQQYLTSRIPMSSASSRLRIEL